MGVGVGGGVECGREEIIEKKEKEGRIKKEIARK